MIKLLVILLQSGIPLNKLIFSELMMLKLRELLITHPKMVGEVTKAF